MMECYICTFNRGISDKCQCTLIICDDCFKRCQETSRCPYCRRRWVNERDRWEVLYNGRKLKNAPDRVKDHSEFILDLVVQSPLALQYASDRLRNNKDLALEAIDVDRNAFFFISKNLKRDKDIIRTILQG